MKLSLSMIVKDGLEDLKRLKPLVEPYIDEWVVVFPPKDKAIAWAKKNGIKAVVQDFTQEIEPEFIKQFREYGLEVSPDYRLFNFSNARNASLEACTGDFVLWLDADDTPLGLENVKKFIEKHPDTDVFEAVYDYARDEEGNAASDHIRERVFRNNGELEWKAGSLGLIHETVLPKEGANPLILTIPDNIFRVQHDSDHIDASSLRNHVALLYEYLKTNGEDPRTTLYLGIEYFNRAMYDYCIKVLLEYVKVGGSIEDRFNAWMKIAEAYVMMNDRKSARNAYHKATEEMPHRPDSYLGIGETYFDDGDFAKSVEFLITGLQKKLPQSKQAIDKMKYTFRPAGYICQAYLQLGKPKEAYEWFIRTAQMNPKHPWVQEYAPLFADAKDLDDFVKSFVKLGQIAQRKYPKILSKLTEIVPDELMDQELLMDFKWRYTKPTIWSDKSVVFFCSSAFEDWGPESLIKGCGGSEEAVINLSKELVKLGWDVTVYNNCIKEGTVDGVKWVRFERFNPRDMFNILIGWRNNPFIDAKTAVKKYVDMHDVPGETEYYTETALKGVKLLVKSEYHKSVFKGLADDKFVIIPNGINLSQFDNPEKVKNNIVWTSSYDRGLQHLLTMWPEIKKAVPDATLDVYYGFQLYDQTPWGKKPEGQVWKQKMLQLLSQDGITDHGRVGSDEVAEAYKKADIWAYPSKFPEIDCITATKAMAGKAIPITTNYAAVKERNQGIGIEGDIEQQDVYEQFRDALIELLKDDDRKAAIRKQLNVEAYDWPNIAKQWHEEFKA